MMFGRSELCAFDVFGCKAGFRNEIRDGKTRHVPVLGTGTKDLVMVVMMKTTMKTTMKIMMMITTEVMMSMKEKEYSQQLTLMFSISRVLITSIVTRLIA